MSVSMKVLKFVAGAAVVIFGGIPYFPRNEPEQKLQELIERNRRFEKERERAERGRQRANDQHS